ncbi:MAG: ectonucleotide pyrophosphatase/phosphodiesterase [Pyrinomonadaceae bacterium]
MKNPQKCLLTATLVLLLFATLVLHVGGETSVKDLKRTIILISLDGFRYDYIEKYKPETIDRLAREGVRAKWMIPAFPTKTFPNHYTIATGLYPEDHGIIENNIYDFGVVFSLGKREEVRQSRWWLGEPIWVTAEKQGVKAGAFFFPGTEAEIAGTRPTFWREYDGKVPNEERVDAVLKWLDLPRDQRPRIFTLYFSDVDDAGHSFGPDAPQTRDAVLKVDKIIRRLVDGLTKRNIHKNVNLIIISDHGMAAVDQRNAVVMDRYLNSPVIDRVLTTGEIWQIFPKAEQLENAMQGLKLIEHATCWRKSEIPARLRYQDSPRIAPIVCSAEEGWFMTNRERYEVQKKRTDFDRIRGAHGYDNRYQSMQALFVAHGPAFKKGYVAEPFENVHVYELMCEILGLKPAKNDGDLRRVKRMLR